MFKIITDWFAPFSVHYVNRAGQVEIHKSWSFTDALEWVACSLRDETAIVYRFNRLVASRQTVEG